MEILLDTRAKTHILNGERAITIDIAHKLNREPDCRFEYQSFFPCVRPGKVSPLKKEYYIKMDVDDIEVFLHYKLLEYFSKIHVELSGFACFKMLIAKGHSLVDSEKCSPCRLD